MPVDKSPDPEREAIREKFRVLGFYQLPDRETEFLGMFREAVSRHLGRNVETSEIMTSIADIAGVMAGMRRIVKYNVCYRYQGEKMHAGQYETEPEARGRARQMRIAYSSVWIEPLIVCEGLPEFQPDDADDNDDEVTAAVNRHDRDYHLG